MIPKEEQLTLIIEGIRASAERMERSFKRNEYTRFEHELVGLLTRTTRLLQLLRS